MYVGRFAPTTSGPLHLGSLLAAVASYLDARASQGKWLLRLDDIDVPRTSASAESVAKTTLRMHGLNWDGEATYQTDNQLHYEQAITRLRQRGLLFYCSCSRAQLRGLPAYPGTCRHVTSPPSDEPRAIRVRVPDANFAFDDRIQGLTTGNLSQVGGDFIVKRKEGIVSYPLAVVVDDALAGVTDVVRGADLAENTLAQLYLIDLLGFDRPQYAHIPVLNQRNEIKLSKRDKAVEIDNRFAHLNMLTVLHLLGFNPPARLEVDALLDWATNRWDISKIPQKPYLDHFISI